MKIKVIHPPFDNHSLSDLVGHSFLIKVHASGKILLGKMTFNTDSTKESITCGDDIPKEWFYAVTNGTFRGEVFYKPSEVDVLCMVAEDMEGKL